MNEDNVYLIELTDIKNKELLYYPFIIWDCFSDSLGSFISHIEMYYGKIKTVWKCDSALDAINWRAEVLKMRNQEAI